MINKKELEIELAKKEVLREGFDKILELEKRIDELDGRFRRHVNNIDVHTSLQ